MKDSMVNFLLFYFWAEEFLFAENFFQKIKHVCWSLKLKPRLIWICRFRWWFSIFPFLDRIYYFFINLFSPKIQNFHFQLKFGTWTISNLSISIVTFTFFILSLFKICQHFDVTWLIFQRLKASSFSCFTIESCFAC